MHAVHKTVRCWLLAAALRQSSIQEENKQTQNGEQCMLYIKLHAAGCCTLMSKNLQGLIECSEAATVLVAAVCWRRGESDKRIVKIVSVEVSTILQRKITVNVDQPTEVEAFD
jgi:hypothetical protein